MRLLVLDAATQAEAALALAKPGVQIAIAGRELASLLSTVLALRAAGAEVYGDWLAPGETPQAFREAARSRFGDEDFERVLG